MDFQLTFSYKEYSVYPSIPSIFWSLLGVYYPSQAVPCPPPPRMTEFGSGKIADLSLEDQAPALPEAVPLQVT